MRDQPVDYERQKTQDQRLEEFELWVDDEDRGAGRWIIPAVLCGAVLWVAFFSALLGGE